MIWLCEGRLEAPQYTLKDSLIVAQITDVIAKQVNAQTLQIVICQLDNIFCYVHV